MPYVRGDRNCLWRSLPTLSSVQIATGDSSSWCLWPTLLLTSTNAIQHVLRNLNDNDIKLMLLHVEGELESDEEKDRADRLLNRLRAVVGERSVLG